MLWQFAFPQAADSCPAPIWNRLRGVRTVRQRIGRECQPPPEPYSQRVANAVRIVGSPYPARVTRNENLSNPMTFHPYGIFLDVFSILILKCESSQQHLVHTQITYTRYIGAYPRKYPGSPRIHPEVLVLSRLFGQSGFPDVPIEYPASSRLPQSSRPSNVSIDAKGWIDRPMELHETP
jgi:hypothetical protein